jgi:hypothetical protein
MSWEMPKGPKIEKPKTLSLARFQAAENAEEKTRNQKPLN